MNEYDVFSFPVIALDLGHTSRVRIDGVPIKGVIAVTVEQTASGDPPVVTFKVMAERVVGIEAEK